MRCGVPSPSLFLLCFRPESSRSSTQVSRFPPVFQDPVEAVDDSPQAFQDPRPTFQDSPPRNQDPLRIFQDPLVDFEVFAEDLEISEVVLEMLGVDLEIEKE